MVAFALLAGCTTTSAGQPTPAATDTSSTAPETSEQPEPEGLPFAGAPKVDKPIDTSRFQQDPCLSLTADQATELNLGATGAPFSEPLGKACKWRNDATRGEAQVRFLDKDPRGLSPEYQAEKDGKWKFFVEMPSIDGHPAVARGSIDARDNGACSVIVGASDEIAFELALQLSAANVGKKDPCSVAADIAGMALQTMA
jgi:hypothetical protein